MFIILLILTAFRFAWINYHLPPDHTRAEQGIIDLRDTTLDDRKTITLDGEWEFFPNVFLDEQEPYKAHEQRDWITVPENFNKTAFFSDSLGHGTYRVKVLLQENQQHQQLGIRFNQIDTAAKVYVNGKPVAHTGNPATTKDEHTGQVGPFYGSFATDKNELDILIHVSNYDNYISGGITKSIQFGTDQAIHRASEQSKSLQLTVSIIFLLHFIYVLVIYYMGKGKYQQQLFFYGLMLLLTAFTILVDDEIIIHLPVDYVWSIRILNLLFLFTLCSLITFIKHLFLLHHRVYNFLLVFFILLVIAVIMTPFRYFTYVQFPFALFYAIAITYLFYFTIKRINKGDPDNLFILIFIAGYTSNVFWGALINLDIVDIPYYPFDFFIYTFSIAILLIRRHMRIVELNMEQTKQLQKADKVKDEFLADTSHELRNPLHGMINIAQTTLDDGNLIKKDQENLMLLIDIGKRMSFTLNDLNAVTQLKEGRVILDKKNVDLHAATTVVISMLEFMKEGKDIALRTNIPPSFPAVYADENRLIQILFNLVHNAIKFTKEGAVIVDAKVEGEMVTIYVKDTGVGIHLDDPKKVFAPYESTNVDYSRLTGVGIGLSVSKKLVELHGGTIGYESSKEGTTFLFTLPLAQQKDTHQEVHTDIQKGYVETAATQAETNIDSVGLQDHFLSQTKPTVLIVDDDPINVKIMYQLLANHYDIITAFNGQEALHTIEKHQFDLIISDVMMPYMSGYELTKRIRKQFEISELPILLITARNQSEDIHLAFESGANDYLLKPVNAFELKMRAKALTDLKRSVEELLRLEAAWLQAQIHPHFLFNTLNSIAALAEMDTNRMVDLLEAFGNYLRRSFSIANAEPEIPLENELELTRAYIHIEKERFQEKVVVEYDIDDDLDIKVPPLSIQPLVENAVMHGILGKTEGGTVQIQIKELDDHVQVVIKDNGVGMEQDKIDELLDLNYTIEDGVGVKNTNRRLTQLYGKGLVIESTPGSGTTVHFRIPK